MKRVVVVIHSHQMNNWDVLPQCVVVGDNEYEVIFHRDARVSIVNGKPHFNFDILIDSGTADIDGMKPEQLVPANRYIALKRYNKIEQQLLLSRLVAMNETDDPDYQGLFDNYLPVGTHFQRQSSGASHLVGKDGMVVIKPLDGARGIGQFLIDTNHIPLAVVVETLDNLRNNRIEIEDVIPALTKYHPKLQYSSAGEKSENEGLMAIKLQGYCIQNYIPNIKAEYRLLTSSDGHIAYCQKRDIRTDKKNPNSFAQATGSETNSAKGTDIVDIQTVLKGKDLEALNELTFGVVGPASSVDLFVTEDGKWGIFEFCNQFGLKGVPYKIAHDLHCEVLLSIIKRAGL